MKNWALIKLLILLLLAGGAFNSFAGIYLDSTRTTASNCANDGTIKIYAHSNTSLLYAITSGPDIRPAQSGSQFSGLPSGFYVITITDFANDTVTVGATVNGNYTFPDFSPGFNNPYCSGSTDGVIVGNATQGRPPFNWVLTNTGSGAVTTQASDSFFNLPAGSYNLRQYDTCFNFATYSVTLAAPFDSFSITQVNNQIFTCDSVRVGIQLFIDNGAYFPPYTIQIQTHNGTYQHILALSGYNLDWYPSFNENVGGVSYGDYINITITDACGKSAHLNDNVSPFHIANIMEAITTLCQYSYEAFFYLDHGYNVTYMPNPISVVVTDSATGAYVDSFVTVDTISHSSYYAYSPPLPPGRTYSIKLTDACGHVFTQIYNWPTVPAPDHYGNAGILNCLDSVASYVINWQNTFTSYPVFTLLSGPSTIHSSKLHFQYTDSIIYPLTLLCIPGFNSYGISLTNLAAGTYHYTAYDTCGHVVLDSFTILPSDLSDHHFDMSYIRGCPGQNKIVVTEPGQSATIVLSGILPNQTSSMFVYPVPDTISNISQGPYYLSVGYAAQGDAQVVNEHLGCFAALDTLVIPPYQLPQINYATQIKCNGTVNVGLLPDSSKGIAPYTYQILSGPQTYINQSSNFFTFTTPGIYVARISDTCGFAQTFTFSVDTLLFNQVIKIGSSCLGDRVALAAQSSPYATYIWQRPDGTLYTGDSLIINPVGNNDYGIYHITKYVSVNNCRDTVQLTYTLTSSSITNITAAVCNGHGILFAGHTYTAPGIYYDTIQTALCDSVVILTIAAGYPVYTSEMQTICAGRTLTFAGCTLGSTGFYHDTLFTVNGCDSIHTLYLIVSDMPYDSATLNLCTGQSITVGPHTYNTTGIYRDTLISGTGCDSVYVLNLTVGGFKYDSSAQSICTGQSIMVGVHTYNTTGIYRDTLTSIGGCDSVCVLNLTVSGFKYDSLAQSICTGQSVTVGIHHYSATGIYRDTLTSGGGCDSVYVLNLTVSGMKYDSSAQSICNGQSIQVGLHSYGTTGIYRDTLTASGGCDSVVVLNLKVNQVIRDTITVGFCTGDSALIDGVSYATAGIYTDTFSTVVCNSIRIIEVTVVPKPGLHISASATTVSAGDTIQLDALSSAAVSYSWNSLSSFNNAYIQNPVLTADQSAWVVARVTGADHCVAIDSLFIEVLPCKGNIFAPNIFTPNGDGHNDEYKVYGNCVTLKRLQIFDRWGEQVWETTDMQQGWNGYYKGSPAPIGVYVYQLSYVEDALDDNGVKERKGSITLLR